MADDSAFRDFVTAHVKHPLLLIRFAVDADLGMVFQALEHETTGALTGVGLVPVRPSRGVNFLHLNPELLTEVFAPQITPVGTSGRDWLMKIQPLSEDLRIQKRPNGKYVCFYPFKQQGRNGQIHDVWVDGTRPPQIKLWFTVHATFQPAKDAPKQSLEARVDCPDAFTRRLLQMTGSD